MYKHEIFVLILAALSSCSNGHKDFEPMHPTIPIIKTKTLKEFIKLVEEHDMNVTVITSTEEKWHNLNTKQKTTLAITFSSNTKRLTKSKLTEAKVEQFLKYATAEKLPAGAQGFPNTDFDVKNTETGFPIKLTARLLPFDFDMTLDDNFAAQITLQTSLPDGKKETTRVLVANLLMEAEDNENMNQEELLITRSALVSALFMYESKDVPRVVVEILKKQLQGHDWQVAYRSGEFSHLNSKKYALWRLTSDDTLFTVFAI